jgi:hypothetical protein
MKAKLQSSSPTNASFKSANAHHVKPPQVKQVTRLPKRHAQEGNNVEAVVGRSSEEPEKAFHLEDKDQTGIIPTKRL